MHIADKKVTLEMGCDRSDPTEVTDGNNRGESTTDYDNQNTSPSSGDNVFVEMAVQDREERVDAEAHLELLSLKINHLLDDTKTDVISLLQEVT